MPEKITAIRTFALNAVTYTPIVTPIQCSFYDLIGTDDALTGPGPGTGVQRSSDGTDANSCPMLPGFWYAFLAPQSPWARESSSRWLPGEIVCYLKAASGTPNVFVEFSK